MQEGGTKVLFPKKGVPKKLVDVPESHSHSRAHLLMAYPTPWPRPYYRHRHRHRHRHVVEYAMLRAIPWGIRASALNMQYIPGCAGQQDTQPRLCAAHQAIYSSNPYSAGHQALECNSDHLTGFTEQCLLN